MLEISVIIAAFNAEDYIEEAIDSALNQTHPPSEIIVVDDGSTDSTSSIIERYIEQHAHIRLIKQQNQGIVGAKNAAVQASTKPWIAMLDADDIWHKDKLKKQVLQINPDDQILGLIYCWSIIINPQGEPYRLSRNASFEGYIWGTLLTECLVGNGSTPLMRKEAFVQAGGYTYAEDGTIQGTEDWALYVKIAERYTFAVAENYLVKYRIHEANVSSGHQMMEAYFKDMLLQYSKRYAGLPSYIYRYAASSFYSYMMSRSYSENKFWPAGRFGIILVKNDPAQLLNSNFWRIFLLLGVRMALCLIIGKKKLTRLVSKVRKNRLIDISHLEESPPFSCDNMKQKTIFSKLYWKRIQKLSQLRAADYLKP